MRWLLMVIGLSLTGCPATNTPPDAFMRDAGPPDPAASMNCRASLLLPRGTYWMGTDSMPGTGNNYPAHQVTLSRDAWVATYEATNACYRACMDSGGCDLPGGYSESYLATVDSRRPVVSLYREQAEAYCAWLGGRLLTESEWEAMARGPEALVWPWCSAPADPRLHAAANCRMECEMANWNRVGRCPSDGVDPSPVGSHPAARGPFGHEDVVANATEWVLGALVFPYPSELQVDPILEGSESGVGRASPLYRSGDGDTARCLFTSPPEPLYVQE